MIGGTEICRGLLSFPPRSLVNFVMKEMQS